MCEMYGHELQLKDQRFYNDHASALRCALRLPAEIAVHDTVRDRSFPPRSISPLTPVTELGNLAARIETLRDTEITVSFKTGVVLETCGLLEGFALEDLAEFSKPSPSPDPWYLEPAVIIVDKQGRPIGIRKTAGAKTTLLTEGIDEQTEALAGAVVRLCGRDGQDLTSEAVTATKHPDIKVTTLEKLTKVVVDRYATFTLSPDFVRRSGYGNECTRVSLQDVKARLSSVTQVAGVT